MSDGHNRRAFIKGAGVAVGITAGVGAVGVLSVMKKQWDPMPKVISAGITEIETAHIETGKLHKAVYRGKPVFVIKKSTDATEDSRDIVIGDARFTMIIAICTHLGCIPSYNGDKKNFKCACHGGEFDENGRQTFGPPPKPLVIPPFDIQGTVLVLGVEGDQYRTILSMQA